MRLLYRSYHRILKWVGRFAPFPESTLITGTSAFSDLQNYIQSQGIRRPLLVTDAGIIRLDLAKQIHALADQSCDTLFTFSDVEPDPSIDTVLAGKEFFLENQCDAIIALGGGSVMDAAKLIAACAAKPNVAIHRLYGLFKVRTRLAPLIAIPTTAGTGSEATIAAVVSDRALQQKFAITDFCLLPKVAVLAPELTKGLPAQLTATTGIDALTHALEAYLGVNGNQYTDEKAMLALSLIFKYLKQAHDEPDDLFAREQMLLASYYAGQAFTRTSVGYVHAIAHQLGGLYHTPHGLANAIVLPQVLAFYGPRIEHKLAMIAKQALGFDSDCGAAEHTLDAISTLLSDLGIPSQLAELNESDIAQISERALAEAHPAYPVPKFMSAADMRSVLQTLLVKAP